jgi:hypothetical protein
MAAQVDRDHLEAFGEAGHDRSRCDLRPAHAASTRGRSTGGTAHLVREANITEDRVMDVDLRPNLLRDVRRAVPEANLLRGTAGQGRVPPQVS